MTVTIGSAEYLLTVNQQGLVTGLKQAETTAASSAGKIGSAFAGTQSVVGRSMSGMGSAVSSAMSGVGSAISGGVKAFGAFGLAVQGVRSAVDGIKGIGNAFGLGALNEMEQTRASFNAFTKDAGKTEEIMAMVRKEAALTPFAFGEMAKATASLMPVAKSSGAALMDLVKEAEILAASNPLEGLEGASFSLREAMTGDFTSIIERFNLSRSTINKLKEEGVPNLEIVRRAMQEMGFDSDLIAAKAETLEGRWSTFLDTMTTLQTKIGQPIFDVLKESLVVLQHVLDSNMGTFEMWADTIAGGISEVVKVSKDLLDIFLGGDSFDAAAERLDRLFPADVTVGILNVVKNLGDTFRAVFEGDIPAVIESVQGVLAGFGDIIVGFVEDWASKIAGWVDGADSELLGNLADMSLGIQAWLFDTGLVIIEKLGAWAAAFVDWIGPKIPGMLREMGGFLASMTGWVLGTALPTLVSKLGEWGEAFVDWIEPRIDPMLLEAGKLLAELGGWLLGTALPAIVSKLVEWGDAFTAWIGPKIPGMIAELVLLQGRLTTWMIMTALPAIIGKLVQWGDAFTAWIAKDVLPKLPAALMSILTAVTTWVTGKVSAFSTEAARIGTAIVKGVQDGIAGALTGFWNWLSTNFIEKIPTTIRQILNLQADTGALAKVGERMVEELKVGISNRWPTLEQLWQRLGLGLAGVEGAGGALLQQISGIAAKIGGMDFARAAVAISASETSGGRLLSEVGGTGAQGPFQFDPGGELKNFARYLKVSVDEAGKIARSQPLLAAQWALKNYLGDALRAGLKQGLTGPALAVYGSRVGQRPREGLEVKAGEWYERLFPGARGYADGGWIEEPIIGRGLKSGRAYTFGERERELVTPLSHMGMTRTPGIGAAPAIPNYARIGDTMAELRGLSSGGSVDNSTSIVVHNVNGSREVAREIERSQKAQAHLRGVRR